MQEIRTAATSGTLSVDRNAVRRSFTDLRTFARDRTAGFAPATQTGPVQVDTFFTKRRYLRQGQEAVLLGAIDLGSGHGAVNQNPHDEFVIVCDGTVVFEECDGTSTVLKSGDSAVLQKGCQFNWRVEISATLIFVGYQKSELGSARILPIRPDASMSPSKPPSADVLIGATPDCQSHVAYQSADEVFVCGTWQATPYRRRGVDYKYYELMYLLEGAVTFENPDGSRGTFSQGDIFVIEQQAQCAWDSAVKVSKVFVVASD
jgi:uncharacterized cupin superfamily protein